MSKLYRDGSLLIRVSQSYDIYHNRQIVHIIIEDRESENYLELLRAQIRFFKEFWIKAAVEIRVSGALWKKFCKWDKERLIIL